ncbi:cytidine deaminase [Aliibacillus thermotolerans]|uniref:Cytidine deaminase n=1 Tax=Aliibacillus thermotolerans TaxID=1834418 RepID=A0ABW0UAD0_9BACI|nr:cytidine deaminase [Aliibacillus thermotolerans]MDA3130736.1 cytidine deaminase [Aliibacillus thermotolerans]
MTIALVKEAIEARSFAYAPYSRFSVGAAVQTAKNHIYTGCNIENASYSLTNCAERLAIFKAVSEGEQKIDKLAVVADTLEPVTPCGACRQVMAEFMPPDGMVYLANINGNVMTITVKELLPGAFQAEDFKR